MDEQLRALHRYWLSKRGERRMPARRNIDPIEIPELLPSILLVEIEGARLKFRLAGSLLVDLYGFDPTRRYFDEALPPERLKAAVHNHALVTSEARPMLVRSKFIGPSDSLAILTRLMLPLSEDDVSVNMVLTGVRIERGPALVRELLGQKTGLHPKDQVQFL